MLNEKLIKPIPKHILETIHRCDSENILNNYSYTRYYAYLTQHDGELIKITVACKCHKKKWYYKQVAVHGIHTDECIVKDIDCFRICGYITSWYEQGLQRHRKWWESGEWETAYDKYFNMAPVINPEYALIFPEYKYSAVDEYGKWDVFKYLRIYEKYPQAEMLVKLGLLNYATNVRILQKVGKDKRFRKWLINNRQELSMHEYYTDTLLSSYETGKSLKDTQQFLKRKKSFDHEKDYKPIRKLFKGKMLERFFNYIDTNPEANYRSYADYAVACTFLKLDMTQAKNAFPHDFKKWHDIRIDQYNTAKPEYDRRKFASIAEKYLPLQNFTENGLVVFIAKNNEELKRESEYLHHCVGLMNYDQKMIREETLIFFIRKAETVDTPFVTVEYSIDKKSVLQCYGNKNFRPDEYVTDFVHNQWLPYANKTIKKIQAAA